MTAREGIRKATRVLLGIALLGASTACSDSSTEPEETVPTVTLRPVDDAAQFDTGLYKRTCLSQPGAPVTVSNTCPVVQWDGYEYWALSYHDNRSSFAIHAYDPGGDLLEVVEGTGARYAYTIDVDVDAETVIFVGQDERTVTMTWDELRDLR
jgi:hypothetical protein